MKQIKNQEPKLVVVTRTNLGSVGHTVCQSTHSIADFSAEFPETFKNWKKESNSIICLAIPNEDSLLKLHEKIKKLNLDCSLFYEPDVNAYTSLCFYAPSDVRKKFSHLPLIK